MLAAIAGALLIIINEAKRKNPGISWVHSEPMVGLEPTAGGLQIRRINTADVEGLLEQKPGCVLWEARLEHGRIAAWIIYYPTTPAICQRFHLP